MVREECNGVPVGPGRVAVTSGGLGGFVSHRQQDRTTARGAQGARGSHPVTAVAWAVASEGKRRHG
ncbi:hypothetical protein E2562_031736 [Oryza meyeriana var. granulata]|uniref:Uncharacterized protein n=1 Tax=Oryza meyeriana var. granulata TaxID=110450 RepID=A0A6G1CV94_9ORYZ|nr:hypothetical protein E2562_031736 [Oryza meyeriana var. granulata]